MFLNEKYRSKRSEKSIMQFIYCDVKGKTRKGKQKKMV